MPEHPPGIHARLIGVSRILRLIAWVLVAAFIVVILMGLYSATCACADGPGP